MSRRNRGPDAIRPMSISHSVLSRADGSASFSFGNLTVLASVNGPQEVRIRDELVDRASLEINVRPLRNSSGPREKTIEEMLRSLFEPVIRLDKYPRAQIQINVQTTSAPASNDHSFSLSEKSAIVNSVTCALMDAAIEMDALLLAVALVRNPEDELLYLDPNVHEEANASSLLWFAGRIAGGQTETVGVEAVNWQDSDQLFEAIERASDAVKAVHAFVRKSVEARYTVDGGGDQDQSKTQPRPESTADPSDSEEDSDVMKE